MGGTTRGGAGRGGKRRGGAAESSAGLGGAGRDGEGGECWARQIAAPGLLRGGEVPCRSHITWAGAFCKPHR